MSKVVGNIAKMWKLAKSTKNKDTPLYSFISLIWPFDSNSYTYTLIEKVKVLRNSFFCFLLRPKLDNICDYEYLQPFECLKIIIEEIELVMYKVFFWKILSHNKNSNKILVKAISTTKIHIQ